jgi:hypothetical protein
MTTIAASVKTGTIAGDRQYTYSGTTKFLGAPKVIAISDKLSAEMFGVPRTLIGFAGNADVWGQVVTFFADPTRKLPKLRNIEFLMLNKNGIYHATTMENWTLLNEKHFAIGSGMNFAMASMESGKTPKEACKVASKYDVMTGLGYTELTL